MDVPNVVPYVGSYVSIYAQIIAGYFENRWVCSKQVCAVAFMGCAVSQSTKMGLRGGFYGLRCIAYCQNGVLHAFGRCAKAKTTCAQIIAGIRKNRLLMTYPSLGVNRTGIVGLSAL